MAEENKKVGGIDNFDSLRDRLMAVTNEIDAIKNSFTKSTQELSRIQSMLDVGNIDEISGVLDKFEDRIAEEERKRMEAAEGAKRYSEELEKEKERLIKLWDAYKNQEQELSNMEKRMADYEDKVKTAEASKKELEDDMNARINTLTEKLKETPSVAGDRYRPYCRISRRDCRGI